MTDLVSGAVDTDVHVEPPSIDALKPYLSGYWLEFIRGARSQLGTVYPPSLPTSARPEARAAGTFPPRSYEALKAQLLDPYQPRYAVLTSLTSFTSGWNPYYEAAIARATNEWMRDEMLAKDDRLRASISVPLLDPVAAAAEIDRVAADRRFVQVILPIRSQSPWGNVRWQPIHDACNRNHVVMALHAWGQPGGTPTNTGYARTHLQDSVSNAQLVAPQQILSIICEGVFKRNPDLKISLQELGFNWVHALLWRFDKDWKGVWREVPWVKEEPSRYVASHFHFTTAPAHLPTDDESLGQLLEMLGGSQMLVYASDFPHEHGAGIEPLLDQLDGAGREALLRGTASELFGLGAPA